MLACVCMCVCVCVCMCVCVYVCVCVCDINYSLFLCSVCNFIAHEKCLPNLKVSCRHIIAEKIQVCTSRNTGFCHSHIPISLPPITMTLSGPSVSPMDAANALPQEEMVQCLP